MDDGPTDWGVGSPSKEEVNTKHGGNETEPTTPAALLNITKTVENQNGTEATGPDVGLPLVLEPSKLKSDWRMAEVKVQDLVCFLKYSSKYVLNAKRWELRVGLT